MKKGEYLIIKKMVERVLREPKYSWMVDSDVLLSREDFLQEILIRYLNHRDSLDYKREQHLYVYVSSRVKDIKKIVDRASGKDLTELNQDIPFEDNSSLRVSVRDALNTSCLSHNLTKEETDMLFRYHVYGESQSEISETHKLSQQFVSKKLRQLFEKISPDMRELLDNIKGVDMC